MEQTYGWLGKDDQATRWNRDVDHRATSYHTIMVRTFPPSHNNYTVLNTITKSQKGLRTIAYGNY